MGIASLLRLIEGPQTLGRGPRFWGGFALVLAAACAYPLIADSYDVGNNVYFFNWLFMAMGLSLIWGYGGSWSDEWDFSPVASEQTVEAIEFAQDATGDWASVSSGDPADDFGSGATSQIVQSTGSLGGILDTADFEVGVAFLPGGPEAEGETPTGGAGLMISADSEPEEQLAAAMFIGFMTNTENTAMFSEATGYMPVQQDADMSAVYEETPQFEVAVQQLERARSQDNARVFLPGGDLELSQTLQSILTNDVDVAEEMESVQSSLEELYERDLASELE